MLDLIRALPQGLFWYPLLLFLLVLAARTLWQIRPVQSARQGTEVEESGNLGSLSRLVLRARTDSVAQQELERRSIGLLLEANDFSGYSVDNCRRFAAGSSGTQSARDLVAEHLAELTGRGNGERSGGTARQGGPGSAGAGSRFHMILGEVERLAEVPGE